MATRSRTPTSRTPTEPPVDLSRAGTFVNGPPHEQLAELRRTDPVFWHPMRGQPGFWAVLRHADVAAVSRNTEVFSSAKQGFVMEDLDEDRTGRMRKMLLGMDPPAHRRYRDPLAPHLRARILARLEDRVRDICRQIMADALEQGEVEFVHDVTSGLPTRVFGELMGLPEADWGYLHDLAERNMADQDPDAVAADGEYGGSIVEMAMYAIQFAAQRRGEEPREDLASVILEARFDGEPMSDIDFGSFFVQLVTAGNDTTKTMLSSGMLTLLRHPDQLAELRVNPALIPRAVEEIIRYDNPLHYFRRTATRDTELAGVPIAAGDKVVMYYTSANRDEAVFDRPQEFDIHRHPNPHLSFGFGEHFCLGAHLARLEGKVFFEELLGACPTIELIGEPVRVKSNLNNSLKRLPVRLGTDRAQ